MDGGLRPLADLMGKLREAGADKALEIRIIRGPDVTAALSVSARAAFIGAAGALGWKVSDANGTLNVSNSRQ
jgi:hypothetical protein